MTGQYEMRKTLLPYVQFVPWWPDWVGIGWRHWWPNAYLHWSVLLGFAEIRVWYRDQTYAAVRERYMAGHKP